MQWNWEHQQTRTKQNQQSLSGENGSAEAKTNEFKEPVSLKNLNHQPYRSPHQ